MSSQNGTPGAAAVLRSSNKSNETKRRETSERLRNVLSVYEAVHDLMNTNSLRGPLEIPQELKERQEQMKEVTVRYLKVIDQFAGCDLLKLQTSVGKNVKQVQKQIRKTEYNKGVQATLARELAELETRISEMAMVISENDKTAFERSQAIEEKLEEPKQLKARINELDVELEEMRAEELELTNNESCGTTEQLNESGEIEPILTGFANSTKLTDFGENDNVLNISSDYSLDRVLSQFANQD